MSNMDYVIQIPILNTVLTKKVSADVFAFACDKIYLLFAKSNTQIIALFK